jgi:putative FmdB family regulatory protein
MPIYEYICTECDHAHEALQKLSDDPLLECPACGETALKKKISAPGFRLSGTGWYETDFKSDKQRNLTDSGSKKEPEKKAAKESVKKEPAKSKDAAA